MTQSIQKPGCRWNGRGQLYHRFNRRFCCPSFIENLLQTLPKFIMSQYPSPSRSVPSPPPNRQPIPPELDPPWAKYQNMKKIWCLPSAISPAGSNRQVTSQAETNRRVTSQGSPSSHVWQTIYFCHIFFIFFSYFEGAGRPGPSHESQTQKVTILCRFSYFFSEKYQKHAGF